MEKELNPEWNGGCLTQNNKSFFELKLFSPFVGCFFVFLFWSSVFGIWRFWFTSLQCLGFSRKTQTFQFFFLRASQLIRQVSPQFCFFFFGVYFTMPSENKKSSSPAVGHYLVSKVPLLRSAVLSILSILPTLFTSFPSSVCVYFWLRETSEGKKGKRETIYRWIRRRDGFG